MEKIKYLLSGFLFSAGSPVILYIIIPGTGITISPIDILYPTIFSVVVFFVFVLTGYLFSHDLESAGLMASVLILGLFYLWPIFSLILFITLVCLILFKLILKKVGFERIHLILNAISIGVVGYYLYCFISMTAGLPWASYQTTIQQITFPKTHLPSFEDPPDIYYIVLDSYGRADMLQDIYNFDNSAFIDELEQRGFVVESDSQANYPNTLLSLSSSFNMQYLDTMSQVMGDSNLWWPVMDTVHHSEIRNILQNWGYKTVFLLAG